MKPFRLLLSKGIKSVVIYRLRFHQYLIYQYQINKLIHVIAIDFLCDKSLSFLQKIEFYHFSSFKKVITQHYFNYYFHPTLNCK